MFSALFNRSNCNQHFVTSSSRSNTKTETVLKRQPEKMKNLQLEKCFCNIIVWLLAGWLVFGWKKDILGFLFLIYLRYQIKKHLPSNCFFFVYHNMSASYMKTSSLLRLPAKTYCTSLAFPFLFCLLIRFVLFIYEEFFFSILLCLFSSLILFMATLNRSLALK